MYRELPDVQVGFRKGRGTKDQTANIHGIKEKNKRIPEKHLTSASLTTLNPLTVWITTNWKILKRDGNTRPPYLPPEKLVYRSRSNS